MSEILEFLQSTTLKNKKKTLYFEIIMHYFVFEFFSNHLFILLLSAYIFDCLYFALY